jgi:3-dehydroquinate dehydratase-2
MKILVLNGPNLSRLDLREKNYYGDLDYGQLKMAIEKSGAELGFEVEVKQSDNESELIKCITTGKLGS